MPRQTKKLSVVFAQSINTALHAKDSIDLTWWVYSGAFGVSPFYNIFNYFRKLADQNNKNIAATHLYGVLAVIPHVANNAVFHWRDYHNDKILKISNIALEKYNKLRVENPNCASKLDLHLSFEVSGYSEEEFSIFTHRFISLKDADLCGEGFNVDSLLVAH
jgi:hypothetical protein